jgi:hypothetical protein
VARSSSSAYGMEILTRPHRWTSSGVAGQPKLQDYGMAFRLSAPHSLPWPRFEPLRAFETSFRPIRLQHVCSTHLQSPNCEPQLSWPVSWIWSPTSWELGHPATQCTEISLRGRVLNPKRITFPCCLASRPPAPACGGVLRAAGHDGGGPCDVGRCYCLCLHS